MTITDQATYTVSFQRCVVNIPDLVNKYGIWYGGVGLLAFKCRASPGTRAYKMLENVSKLFKDHPPPVTVVFESISHRKTKINAVRTVAEISIPKYDSDEDYDFRTKKFVQPVSRKFPDAKEHPTQKDSETAKTVGNRYYLDQFEWHVWPKLEWEKNEKYTLNMWSISRASNNAEFNTLVAHVQTNTLKSLI